MGRYICLAGLIIFHHFNIAIGDRVEGTTPVDRLKGIVFTDLRAIAMVSLTTTSFSSVFSQTRYGMRRLLGGVNRND